jgi:hypothetical protein
LIFINQGFFLWISNSVKGIWTNFFILISAEKLLIK